MTRASRVDAVARLQDLLAEGPSDPLALAYGVRTKVVEKYDDQLSDELLDEAFAARSLDVNGAWAALGALLDHVDAEDTEGASSGVPACHYCKGRRCDDDPVRDTAAIAAATGTRLDPIRGGRRRDNRPLTPASTTAS